MNTRYLGFASAIVSAVIMGGFGMLVRDVSVGGNIIAFARFGLGFICLSMGLLLSKSWHICRVRLSTALFLSGVFLALCVLLYSQAIKTTTLTNAVFLLYLAPMIASTLGYFFLKEKIGVFKAMLLLLAFAGSLCLIGFDFSISDTALRGQLLALAAALCYAFFMVANRKIAPEISGFSRAFYQLLFGSLILLPFTGRIDLQSLYHDRYELLAIGFLQGFVAITLMILALRHLQAYEYAMVSYLEPIVAAFAGYLVYHESLSWLQGTGCALILVSSFMQIRFSLQGSAGED